MIHYVIQGALTMMIVRMWMEFALWHIKQRDGRQCARQDVARANHARRMASFVFQ